MQDQFLVVRGQVTKDCNRFMAGVFRCFSGSDVLVQVLPLGQADEARSSLLCIILN